MPRQPKGTVRSVSFCFAGKNVYENVDFFVLSVYINANQFQIRKACAKPCQMHISCVKIGIICIIAQANEKVYHYRSRRRKPLRVQAESQCQMQSRKEIPTMKTKGKASAAAVPAAVPDGTAGGRTGDVSPRAGRRPRRSARCGGNLPDHSGGNRLHRRRTGCEQRRHPVARVGSSRHIRPL